MKDEVRIPDIEVIVGCAGDDVAVFCFYLREDIHQGYDVVCCIADQNAKSVIRQILQDALTTLSMANWSSVDELREDALPEETDPPF